MNHFLLAKCAGKLKLFFLKWLCQNGHKIRARNRIFYWFLNFLHVILLFEYLDLRKVWVLEQFIGSICTRSPSYKNLFRTLKMVLQQILTWTSIPWVGFPSALAHRTQSSSASCRRCRTAWRCAQEQRCAPAVSWCVPLAHQSRDWCPPAGQTTTH